jgi:hypothetical protein
MSRCFVVVDTADMTFAHPGPITLDDATARATLLDVEAGAHGRYQVMPHVRWATEDEKRALQGEGQ